MINLLKLCVGVDSVEEQQDWIEHRLALDIANGIDPEQFHTTRMIPKRQDELIDGGSLYWVIKGNIQARQRLLEIRPFRDTDGIRRCKLVLEPKLKLTQWVPRRPFQGWRYLKPEDVPADLNASDEALAPELRADLSELGLL